jgi:hypothetical protein
MPLASIKALASCEPLVGVAQEDQAQDRGGELGGLQAGVGPELVGGGPEAVFNGDEI